MEKLFLNLNYSHSFLILIMFEYYLKRTSTSQVTQRRGETENTWSEQNASEGQTVSNQSCPFKCQLSWKQVQKRRIWRVAEQPGSCLTAPKDSGVPPHGAALLEH